MVEELFRYDFKIMGVIMPNIIVPMYSNSLKDIIDYKRTETCKITLLDENNNNFSTKDISKIQIAKSINDEQIVLYDFSKGLNNKELNYFKILFNKMTNKYGKKIIIVSKDINFLSTVCDTFAIYDKKLIYKTNNIFDDNLYYYVDMPNIVKFIKLANKKGANLKNTVDLNELIKDIYRRIHENKDNI